jgi:hypothetical protein
LEFAPAVVDLASGSLTYDTGTLFLSVSGAAEPLGAGGGCTNPGGPVTFVVTCSDYGTPDAGAANADAATAAGSRFAGAYGCFSSMDQSGDGLQGVSAGSGTLTINESGHRLLAAYTGDQTVQGALAFTATTSSAAVPAAANESVQIRCLTAQPNGQPVPWSALPVSSSTLTLDGTSLLLSLAGIGCNASELTVSLLCTPMVDGGATTDAAALDSGADH